MRKFFWGVIAIVALILTVLSTTGIPGPTIIRDIDCEGNPVTVQVDPHVRLQNFRLTIAGEVSTKSKVEILKCVTIILKREVSQRRLRDHDVKNITVTGPNSLKMKVFIRWYQNKYLRDGKNIDVNASIQPHDQGAIVKYAADVRNVAPWIQDLIVRPHKSSGEKIINKSDFGRIAEMLTLDSLQLIQGEDYRAHFVLSWKLPR